MSSGTTFLGDRAPQLPFLARSGSLSSSSVPNSPSPQQQFVASPPPSSIPPLVSLELRVRWLEALVSGINPSAKSGKETSSEPRPSVSLVRKTDEVQRQVDEAIEMNDGFRRFMNSYDEYEHLLTPAFTLLPNGSTTGAPSYEELSPAELGTFLNEMEPELRRADRDMREIQALNQRGVAGAGKLPEHESLKSRLQALISAHAEDSEAYRMLERRIAALLHRYSSHINALSELFVSWNDSVREAEEHVARLEKVAAEKSELSFE